CCRLHRGWRGSRSARTASSIGNVPRGIARRGCVEVARTVRCGGSLRALRANGTCNARAAAARGARLAPGTVNDLGNLVVMQGLALIDSSFMADRGFTPREALSRARRRRDVLQG